ncbi:anthranilate phosphoribosyltransferase [Yimella sp. cx-51]|uniref:anthranilate phosphoribosyltransferase n=1 Tax=Yimella sp. cx-51 TaxID=2770551 RepID=UPI00165D4319|nr:anthranilate phosphoribosyltransferase [Yimella sp. cx-51]MBC9957600.1 anthranilate phosphoribosyltransferase [Yimella sp. cx-51]QTH37040.1 anthranilate phosphoribosyltransferase [Yimella sp. cx-51]
MSVQLTWSDVLTTLIQGTDLTLEQSSWAMDEIMSGNATPSQLAGFLVALRSKGETVAELRGLADSMVEHAVPIVVDGETLDIVGTGGDRAHTVNISSMASIVCAGAGAKIVKHGNRASSSSTGSADVMGALGVRLDLTPAQVVQVAQDAGITFCFAQTFHPSMRHAAATRREMGIATAFNVLGPMTNPANPRYRAVGVADARVAPLVAGVFAERGQAAAVFRGDDGLDELTLSTASTVWWVHDGEVTQHTVDPVELGLDRAPLESLRGGDSEYNAGVVRELLAGATGPVRDAVLLNAGIALAVMAAGSGGTFGESDDLNAALRRGIESARVSIDSGAAAAALDRWVAATQQA